MQKYGMSGVYLAPLITRLMMQGVFGGVIQR